ncbi:MAG: hypothetical protein K8M05_05425 [Deltaproteobacteria bacterium]|nr:hypothetical protein [Kofleriaceae bacterium]
MRSPANRIAVLALLAAAACGGDGGGGDGNPGVDAAVDGGGDPVDAAGDGWSRRRALSFVGDDDNTFLERREPTLRADELELYYRHRALAVVFRGVRATRSDPWSTPERVTAIETGRYQITPKLSADGRSLYFASDGPAEGSADVWVSTRASVDAPWGAPDPVPALNSDGHDLGASPCLGATRFVLESNREGAYGLYEVAGGETRPILVGVTAHYPYVTEDCLTLYVSAPVDGAQAIHVSRRASVDAAWSTPEVIEELRDATFDFEAPWASAAGDHLVFVDSGFRGEPINDFLVESFR